jgi:hypothetical protein
MIYSDGFDSGYLSENWQQVPLEWVKALRSNLKEVLYSRLCSGAAFLPPLPISEINPLLNAEKWNSEWLGWGSYPPESASVYGLSHAPVFPEVESGLYWWRGLFGEFQNIIAWPGLLLTASAIMIALNRKKRKLNSAPILFLILLGSRHLVLALSGIGLVYRYGFMTHLVAISIAASLLISPSYKVRKQSDQS